MSGTSRLIYLYKSGDTPPLAFARNRSPLRHHFATISLLRHHSAATSPLLNLIVNGGVDPNDRCARAKRRSRRQKEYPTSTA